MSTDTGWWARKLGTPQTLPPQNYAPAPSHHPGYPQTPQGYPQQQAAPPQYQEAPQVTPENLFELTQYWTGGEAHRKEIYACPKCGGGHYYSRSAEVSRGPAPAPMCFDCGYNGMFEQGDPAVWNGGG